MIFLLCRSATSYRRSDSSLCDWIAIALLPMLLMIASSIQARDLSVVPFLDGERDGMNNYWGGRFGSFNVNAITRQTSIVRSGNAAYQIDLGAVSAGSLSFIQSFSSATTSNQQLRQTRDLTRYDAFEGYVRNDTGVPLTIRMELKDYRDTNSHRASKNFVVPAGSTWNKISTSLNLASGWAVDGSPDLERTYITSFVVNPPTALSGSYYIDDFSFVESGGPIDSQTAPINSIVERLAERHFSGLWMGRNRTTGLVYNEKDGVDAAAMNTTGGTLWMLPKAVERGWVNQADADLFVSQVANSLETNLNQSNFVPTRFINPLTAGLPGGGNEESSIDASFIALALHNYKSLPTTSASLAAEIDAVQNRFQLDAFAVPSGFRLAYFPSSGFTSGTYDGYTNEGKVISLAAELSDDHHVPLESLWNSDTNRARVFLVNEGDSHLTHSLTQFRAPFEQALLNLFVDTSDRGADNFPNRALATNPWQNFERYHREVAAKLIELGRDNFFQPDAGSGAPFSGYEQYSLYNDQGEPELFMPWSVALAMLAGADGADDALRTLLDVDGIMGPLGLADSVRWNTGDDAPFFVSNAGDNWNTVLSTMAMLEWLDRMDGAASSSRSFAELPEVCTALNQVFLAGDFNGDGTVSHSDYLLWGANFGSTTFQAADGNNNGIVDGADFTIWRDNFGATVATQASRCDVTVAVPEPSTLWWWLPIGILVGRTIRRVQL